ncbi:pilus assembly protein PilM [Comamonas serinivorans]|uniref:Pilus assembly protein PilM n=1 Tax=Comamonas serinivorans TaxID=1082851 RepID=A0A1Y0EU52_9BURK|nr:pilus assembly protein PilM [Comamonas serinivorans]ARU06929.1 pilus assembly protein PilM [Comamonas serinivorans]
MVALNSLFGRGAPSLVGIDVSASSVKLVELSQASGGRLSVDRCAMELLEPGWITDGNIENLDGVAEAVRRVVKKSGTRTKEAALALPASVVITKKIVLPDGLSELEMEAQVESEANQYIPFSMDEVSLDFCVTGPSANSIGDVDVVLAAARKEKVQDRQALAEAAGLKPVVVDIENLASRLAAERLISRLPGKGADVVIALFELGANNMSMQAIRNGELLYERDQVFGGSQLTQLIVRQYGFSHDEAEQKKRNNELPDDYTATVLKPFMDSTAQEVGRALQFFFTSTPYNKVDYIFLAGGGACMSGIANVVTEHTGFACNVTNPFDGMTMGRTVREPKLAKEAPSYLTACGLAMRRFLK